MHTYEELEEYRDLIVAKECLVKLISLGQRNEKILKDYEVYNLQEILEYYYSRIDEMEDEATFE